MASNLWLHRDTANAKMNGIMKKYDEVVGAANKIGKNLKKDVGVDGRWYDANAATFAKWWNQSANYENGGTGGTLVTDKDGVLIIKGGNKNDGEDKIKQIVQLAGKLFYISVCIPMDALYLTNKKMIDNCWNLDKARTAANMHEYRSELANPNISGRVWSNFMAEWMWRDDWERVSLPITPQDVKSNTNEKVVDELGSTISTDLDALRGRVDEYCKLITEVANNAKSGQDKNKWWGIDNVNTVFDGVTKLKTKMNDNLETFKTSTVTALSSSSKVVKGGIAKLQGLKFD